MDVIARDTLFEIFQNVADAANRLAEVRVRIAAHSMLIGQFEEMRVTGLGRPKGAKAQAMIIPASSGSGKTTIAETYRRWTAARLGVDEETGPVRIITVSELGTNKSFLTSILEGLGDPHAETGTEPTLKKRLRKALVREGVQLLIIDEFNHTAEQRHAARVLNGIKNMLTAGLVPVVVMGTAKEIDTLPHNDGFEGRLIETQGLPPMLWGSATGRQAWIDFCTAYEDAILDARLVAGPFGLAEPATQQALCHVCEGLIGRLVWVADTVLRNSVRSGDRIISPVDLADACDKLVVKYPRGAAENRMRMLLR